MFGLLLVHLSRPVKCPNLDQWNTIVHIKIILTDKYFFFNEKKVFIYFWKSYDIFIENNIKQCTGFDLRFK